MLMEMSSSQLYMWYTIHAELLDTTHHAWKKVDVRNIFLRNLDLLLQLMKMDIHYIDVEMMVFVLIKMNI